MLELLKNFLGYALSIPEKAAVVDEGGERITTYAGLDDMSGRVATWLGKKGIGKEDLITIKVQRGVRFIALRLAAMKAGAAWVGVEEMMGEERIAFIIKDSGSCLVVDDAAFDEALKEEPLPVEQWADPAPHDLAFIFYTSGSTGRPKGVAQEYGIYDYILTSTYRCIKDFGLDTYANISPETFIGGIDLMAGALNNGVTLHIIPLPLVRDPAGLISYFKKHDIQASCMPPTLVKALERTGGLDLKVLHITGEIAVDIYIDRFTVMNAYGPTEFAYLPFFFTLDRAYRNTPIGTPDENTKLVLIDEDGRPDAKEGALCIRLPYFRGYLHDKDRKDFIEIDGETYFKSGDYLSVDDKGNYTILGRIDDMVKINGNRIEPTEVEFAVRKVLGSDFAAVRVWERNGIRYLCAYHNTGEDLDAADMAEKLRPLLPVYMIPACYVSLDEIPLNENGKVDKKDLPEPEEDHLFAAYEGPQNSLQKKLCDIYARVLHIKDRKIGIDDDFFLLGGDSLSAIRIVTEADLADLTVPMIFRERTVRRIDEALGRVTDNTLGKPGDVTFPLKEEQIYFLEQQLMLPRQIISNLPIVLRFVPETDDLLLQKAVVDTFRAHPGLLMVIEEKETGWVQSYRPGNNVEPQTETATEEELERLEEDFVKPFSFDGKPLFRRRIIRTPHELALLLDVHHIICDGYSLKIVVEDILAALDGRPVQEDFYFSLIRGQNGMSDGEKRKLDSEYFSNTYKGDHDRLPAPDLPGTENKAGCFECILPFETQTAAPAAKKLRLSPNAFYLLASLITLGIYNRSKRVMLSWNYTGRSDIRTMRTVGLMIRDYPVALTLGDDDTVRSLAQDLGSQLREAVIHGSVSPFMKRSEGELLCFLYQGDLFNVPDDRRLMDVDYPETSGQGAIEPLELKIYEEDEETRLELNYDGGIYYPESMERFAAIYSRVCETLIRDGGSTKVSSLFRSCDVRRN